MIHDDLMKTILEAVKLGAIGLFIGVMGICAISCVGLLSAMVDRLKVIAGSLSMIAVALDEKCTDDPNERVLMRQIRHTIYQAIVDGLFQSRH